MKRHVRELPKGYVEVYRLSSEDKKAGIIMNVAAVLTMVTVIVLSLIPVFIGKIKFERDLVAAIVMPISVALGAPMYMVLHEIVHGLAYKLLTKEKLRFSINWSSAYCGVPDIYVYRSTALVAVTLPFILFTIIFAALAIGLMFVNTYVYFAFALMLSVHLGGCVGDIYVAALLLFKHRSSTILVRDTGPEQIFLEKKYKLKKKSKKDEA